MGLGTILLVLIGLLVLGFIIICAIFLTGFNEHRKAQRCPECGGKAACVREKTEEAGGDLSFQDAIIVTYRCRRGHTFERRWNVRRVP